MKKLIVHRKREKGKKESGVSLVNNLFAYSSMQVMPFRCISILDNLANVSFLADGNLLTFRSRDQLSTACQIRVLATHGMLFICAK